MNTTENAILSANEIVVRFGGLTAVDKATLSLQKGQILGLIGPNGAGKTTLFNAISGALRFDSGYVEFKGEKLTRIRPHEMCRKGIGRTYQICQPFMKQTLIENVMVGGYLRHRNPKLVREKAEQILEKLNLVDLKDVKGTDLTLIQLKRLEVARALSTEPDVLLLDEVMAGLNPSECAEMMQIVSQIREEGMSIIIVEHVMKAIMGLSDYIYVLNQGRIISEGTPQQVVSDPLVIKSYLGEKRHAGY